MGLSIMEGWFRRKSQDILKGGEEEVVGGLSQGGGD